MRDRNWKREAIASAISWLLLGTMIWLVNLNLNRNEFGNGVLDGSALGDGTILQPQDLLGIGPIAGIIAIAAIAFVSRAITVKKFISRGGYFVVDLAVLLVGTVLVSSVNLLFGSGQAGPVGSNLVFVVWVVIHAMIRLGPIVCIAVVISLFISSIWGTGTRTETE